MLKSLKLHNFKSFLNVELRFDRRHLLLGKNTSGKTNFSKALQFLSATALQDLSTAALLVPGGIPEICNWYLKNDEVELVADCALDFDGDACDYTYSLKLRRQMPTLSFPAQDAELRVVEERLTFTGGAFDKLVLLENDGVEAKMVHEEQASKTTEPQRPKTRAPKNATMLSRLYELDTNRRAILFRQYLQNWAYYSISPLAIRVGATGPNAPQFGALDSFGENLSNVIFQLKNTDERRYRHLIQHAQIIEPALRSINFIPAPDRPPVPFVELEGHPRASWNGLSDGTLRALALGVIIELASAFSPPDWRCSCLGIIEEPENGIHPGQLRRMFDLFEEWAPAAQFLFTSHSPYFIDMFDHQRESVTIFRRSKDRSEAIPPGDPVALNGDEPLPLSLEYATELFE